MIRRRRESVFMEMAVSLSALGTCDRKQVGAIFTKDGRCVTWGYNGAPPGMPHCAENKHGWFGQGTPEFMAIYDKRPPTPEEHEALGRWQDLQADIQGCRNATHAEANALAFAARHGIATDGTTLFVTVSPCLDCSRLLIAAGVRAVFYREEYRDGSGFRLLADAGIECRAL